MDASFQDETIAHLQKHIRDVPDFPKPGILFKDITPLFKNVEARKRALQKTLEGLTVFDFNVVAGVDSRGFLFASLIAHELDLPFVLIRKKGKLPADKIERSFSLEYGESTLEIHKDALTSQDKVLVVDDLLATGGTAAAAAELVEALGAQVSVFSFLIELEFLKGRGKIAQHEVSSLLIYS